MTRLANTAVVWAIGEKVGQVEKNRIKREMFGWPKRISAAIKVGDRILLPNGNDTMTHPFGIEHEGLIHEFEVLAIIEGLENDAGN